MPKKRTKHTPILRHHKPTGQGLVELDGRRIYLGRFDNNETHQRYHQLIAEWIANGRQLPASPDDLTIVELTARFLKHAKQHYRRPDGSPTSELPIFLFALKPLKELYGSMAVIDFGPRALRAVRQRMIDTGWCRTNINKQIGRIRRMFRWAVETELISAEVYHSVSAVSGLRMGRTEARESEPVKPILDSIVNKTIEYMTPTMRAMVELQRLTGMRPGEICSLRTADLDTSGSVWSYHPTAHKMAYFGRNRVVFIGPKAQHILKSLIKHNLQAYIFSPAQSERERRAAIHESRTTPLSYGNKPGSNRKKSPSKKPSEQYTTLSYGRAIVYACDKAFPPPTELQGDALKQWRKDHRWRSNRLRHSFATEIRKEHGLEAAQVLLGHARADVSQVYAERDYAKARDVALAAG